MNVSVAQIENNLRFPGQYYDTETGLHYNWNRYYSPETGRYIAADPIGLGGGINLYAYVGSDPANWVDFYGLYACRYSISAHTMSCNSSTNYVEAPFESDKYVSGNNQIPGPLKPQNNPNLTGVPFHGPIPTGEYTIGPKRANSSRRNLSPANENNMQGRNAFQIHGCSNPATCSEGCIAATRNRTRDSLNDLLSREEGNNTLRVVP